MIDSNIFKKFEPYSRYKSSGVEWLGNLPAHWELRRTKTLLVERSEKGFPDKPLLAATQTKGVVRKEYYESRTVLAMKDLHLLKVVNRGDFVISLRSFQGGIEYARDSGIISPAYTILYPVERIHHAYLSHVFKSKSYITNLSLFVTGIRQGQNVDYEELARSSLPLPPLPEQHAIVRFLDHTTRNIRRYIEAKQRLIGLLEEQRRAIIQQAVTRGLHQGIPLKDSGIEGLGRIPIHWEVMKVTRLFEIGSGTTPSTDYADYYGGDVAWITTSELRESVVMSTKKTVTREALRAYATLCVYPKDSVAVAMYGATIGRIGVLGTEAAVNQACCVFSRPNGIDVWFWFYWLQFRRSYLISLGYGGGQPNLSQDLLKAIRIPIPPLSEQSAIVQYLDKATASIDTAIERTRRQIELMEEYRTRLISDVVTGKVDVREAAAQLPEQLEGAESGE